MMTEIEAVYRNGKLELKSVLPLKEGQAVRVVVLADENAGVKERVAAMHAAADVWLAQQKPDAVESAPDYPTEEWAKLDAEWDELLAELQQHAGSLAEDEIAAEIDEAVRVVREQSSRKTGA